MPKIESKCSRREDRRDRGDRGERKEFSSRDNDRSERKSFRDDHLQSYRLEVGEYHGVQKGDIVIIISYAQMTPEQAKSFQPNIIFPDTQTNTLR